MRNRSFSQRDRDLLRQTHAAARAIAGAASPHRPIDIGDLLVFPASEPWSLEWSVVARHPREASLRLVVPADGHPAAGPCDVAVPADAPGGPLTLRCGFGAWVEERFLLPELRTGGLEREVIERARYLGLEGGNPGAAGADGDGFEGELELEEWRREVLVPGWTALTFVCGPAGRPSALPEERLLRSRAAASRLWEELSSYSAERQRRLVLHVYRFRNWGLCELLCERSRQAAGGDAAQAVHLAELAVLVGSLLDESWAGDRAGLQELLASVRAHLGNAQRVQGDLRLADDTLRQALRHWQGGAGDRFGYGARLLGFLASLRRDQGRLPEALALLAEALALPSGSALTGQILVSQALVHEDQGDLERAIALLRQAAPLLDPAREPRLAYSVRHNLLGILVAAAHYAEARELLPEVARLSAESAGELDRLRLLWHEAEIAAGLGERTRALDLFARVREAFSARSMGYDTALVSLQLAALAAELGDLEAVRRIAAQALPLFQSRGMPNGAIASGTLFVQAVERDAGDAELLRRIADDFRRLGQPPSQFPSERS